MGLPERKRCRIPKELRENNVHWVVKAAALTPVGSKLKTSSKLEQQKSSDVSSKAIFVSATSDGVARFSNE
ncbi:hypothetical protein CRP01_36220 [Flavilitoribacter nigricans DSM 23189 = NBRC 102662]|uniref:Uncharacterized protein n=1 Tax=Flavilitoribacter nigricans (strain ATCC 23147 / DSM 23189 / NBRC 102662 / NCIMB 1420 / SS-2) TaxID=1122177 RepID=A0A2D0MZW8_FLAN2|nr:hypothetical protein CRP01_36220 [Flavilitoribacter nigricans DSM 23189 = NBRC 102662]